MQIKLVHWLSLVLVSVCGCTSSTPATPSGCDVPDAHFNEGDEWCCQDIAPHTKLAAGSTCRCTGGQSIASGLACAYCGNQISHSGAGCGDASPE